MLNISELTRKILDKEIESQRSQFLEARNSDKQTKFSKLQIKSFELPLLNIHCILSKGSSKDVKVYKI